METKLSLSMRLLGLLVLTAAALGDEAPTTTPALSASEVASGIVTTASAASSTASSSSSSSFNGSATSSVMAATSTQPSSPPPAISTTDAPSASPLPSNSPVPSDTPSVVPTADVSGVPTADVSGVNSSTLVPSPESSSVESSFSSSFAVSGTETPLVETSSMSEAAAATTAVVPTPAPSQTASLSSSPIATELTSSSSSSAFVDMSSTVSPSSTVTAASASVSVTPSSSVAPTASAAPSVPVVPPTTPTPPHVSGVVISETNLLLASENIFVELKGGVSDTLEGLTLCIFDGSKTSDAVTSTNFTQAQTLDKTTGFYTLTVNAIAVKDLLSVVVALYLPGTTGCPLTSNKDLQDFVAYALLPAPAISEARREALGLKYLLVVPSPNASSPVSVSRLGYDGTKDNSVFVVTQVTMNAPNNVTLSFTTPLILQFKATGPMCQTSLNPDKEGVRNTLVDRLNQLYALGLSVRQLEGVVQCQRDLFYSFNLSSSLPQQSVNAAASFKTYVGLKEDFKVADTTFSVADCWHDCMQRPHVAPQPTKDKNDIKTTVAVVMSCIVVFIIILISVIIYMRRKQHGIMRQFRMTRLQEDDDMDDMDDFVGGGYDQEPSFSSSRSNLTN